MLDRISTAAVAVALAAALTMAVGGVQAADNAKYPNWKGQWVPVIAPGPGGQAMKFDPTKPAGPGQQAPLTPEYQKILEDSIADQANGGLGNDPTAQCYAAGMPRMMAYQAQEYVVTPEVTYILLGGDDNLRRILTDGRDWPARLTPTYQGYSIGHWIDEKGSGTYDVLEAETRGPFKGPRTYDATGLPLAFDNESTFKERLFLDKKDPNLLHDVITVFDHALTRPWTADKTYRRSKDKYPNWDRISCLEGTTYVTIGKEYYMVTADGYLMPTTKGQQPPDPKYFPQAQK
jgi:hypothetical protein